MCENKQTATLTQLQDDPYKELELYLQKAQKEIGQIFENAAPSSNATYEHVTESDVTWLSAKQPSRGVKVLAQLEALLHGLSRSQMELHEPNSSACVSPSLPPPSPSPPPPSSVATQTKGHDEGVAEWENIDALTAWVEELVDEMNSIGDEARVRDRKREKIVHWLLSDLSESKVASCIACRQRVNLNMNVNVNVNGTTDSESEVFVDEKQKAVELPLQAENESRGNETFVAENRRGKEDILSSESHVSRLSSTTSTLSSTGSQMKPEDVQDFLRRVETSIWESESLKRRKKDAILAARTNDELSPSEDELARDSFLSDVGTQTTPCMSRTCSVLMEEANETQVDDSEAATAGSCNSIDILSTLSVPSSFGEETTDASSTDTAQFEPKSAAKTVSNGQPEAEVAREEVWVKREDAQMENKVILSEPNGAEVSSSDSPCETPSPHVVRETRSDSNICRDEKRRLVLRAPLSAPSSVAPSPMSEKGPISAPVLDNTCSVFNIFNIAPKSSSAPMLDARNLSLPIGGDNVDGRTKMSPSSPNLNNKVVFRHRSQSVKELTELEAVEACNWLRAAGFPQYAQMFEDTQFPINIAAVQKDHYFLDADSLQSLFRRLNTLNKCARMRLDNIPRKSTVDDSDEEDQCALSENWTFQRESGRWSRIPTCLDACVSHLTTPQVVNNGHKSESDADCALERCGGSACVLSPDQAPDQAPDTPPPDARCSAFRRSGSDRLKDGARAFLRRMESFKTRHSKRRNREAVVISGPQVMDTDEMEQRVHQLSCVDLMPSPQLIHRMNVARKRSQSQTEDNNSTSDNNSSQSSTPSTHRNGNYKDKNNVCEIKNGQDSDSGSNVSTNMDVDAHKTRNSSLNEKASVINYRSSFCSSLFCINALSAGQLMILRKLALLKLTALMERYSPSNRSGWSWVMPKFIKRMKNPDYKDKVVFGVPLSVVHQRTGQPLPPSIQSAIGFLKKNAVDAVGIFRKSGVRSRIQKLKNMCEANPTDISYEGQQTYDVADMLKQYFRELPEALLTNKMSETFITIYQYIPEELRLEALQAAVMLIPDENREILQKLLSFLHDVSLQAVENQMTASNLAVCFAPSLFHMNTSRGSNSPRRRKTLGVPDQKELNENRAAHDCLSFMIREHKQIFSVSEDAVFQCRFSFVDEMEPLAMEEAMTLNGFESGTWRSYVHVCVDSLLKECREKVKGWVSVSTHEDAELAFKKIGDGNPLRMWKVSVEVEAPPIELLNRVLRERHLWDDQLVKWRVVYKLDSCSEIFNYVSNGMAPLPARDYCILRSWRSDLPRGACVLVESSVNLAESPLVLGNVRGVVMFSRYLIEPCGSGKSRITHISRVDTKGRSPEWYNRVFGHISALHLLRLGNSFRHNAEGPESKV